MANMSIASSVGQSTWPHRCWLGHALGGLAHVVQANCSASPRQAFLLIVELTTTLRLRNGISGLVCCPQISLPGNVRLREIGCSTERFFHDTKETHCCLVRPRSVSEENTHCVFWRPSRGPSSNNRKEAVRPRRRRRADAQGSGQYEREASLQSGELGANAQPVTR